MNLAEQLSPQKRYEAAIYYLKQGLSASPPPADVRSPKLAMAVAYGQSDDLTHAVELFGELLSAEPNSAELHFALGSAHAHKQDSVRAAEEFRIAYRLDPSNDVTRLSLAKALVICNQIPEALAESVQSTSVRAGKTPRPTRQTPTPPQSLRYSEGGTTRADTYPA